LVVLRLDGNSLGHLEGGLLVYSEPSRVRLGFWASQGQGHNFRGSYVTSGGPQSLRRFGLKAPPAGLLTYSEPFWVHLGLLWASHGPGHHFISPPPISWGLYSTLRGSYLILRGHRSFGRFGGLPVFLKARLHLLRIHWGNLSGVLGAISGAPWPTLGVQKARVPSHQPQFRGCLIQLCGGPL
jgi:hypothetical protein